MRADLGDRAYDPAPLPRLQWSRQLTGALIAASASGVSVGVYEACWSLLMHAHHASTSPDTAELDCLPGCPGSCCSEPAMAMRRPRQSSTHRALRSPQRGDLPGDLSAYPQQQPDLRLGGRSESIGAALSLPSISSLMSQGAADRELSRRQGLYTTSNTASLAVGAGVSGFLFTINPVLPFTVMAAVSAALGLSTLLWWWEGRTQEHVTPVSTADAGRARIATLADQRSNLTSARSGPNERSHRRG